MKKDIEDFDDQFPDGVFTIPRDESEPRVKGRQLLAYCKEKGVEPKDLTSGETQQFLVRKK